MNIRREELEDRARIRAINEEAFGGLEEADMVEKLRAEGAALLSLVAEVDSKVVGHILFSRMWIDTETESVSAVALAPMAVASDYQRRGVGAALIGHGLHALRELGEQVVIVVGHPGYYPRFGFSSQKTQRLKSPFPPEVFMALELRPNVLEGATGTVRYAGAFGL